MKIKILALCLLIGNSQNIKTIDKDVPEKPTLEQLRNTDTVEISFKCYRDSDKPNIDMDSWFKITVAVDDLIDKCYAYPNEKDDELFQEVYKTIDFLRELRSESGKIYSNLYVASSTTKVQETVLFNDHEFKLTNSLNAAHIDQLLNLCHQVWWAKNRTRAELETILNNSFYFVLIDPAHEKIIGYIRTVTDYIHYAAILEVIVDEMYQISDLGKRLVDTMIKHQKLKYVPMIELHCQDNK